MIGTGGIAQWHARALNALSDLVQIVAMCDIVEDRAGDYASKYGGTPYTDLATMLKEEKPDAVVISAPNFMHAPLTLQALEAGAHVFCEKPIATSLVDAYLMKETAERTGKILYIGFNHRFVGKFSLAKELL